MTAVRESERFSKPTPRPVSKSDPPSLPFESFDEERTPREEIPLEVSELVGLIAETLERDFSRVLVLGELTSFKRAASGHCYFTLSDDRASIDAAMWRNDARRLAFEPRVGDEVVCLGRVGVYATQGRMQLYVTSVKPVGAGAAQRALEELRRRLAAEGLFAEERKRPLPFLPTTIGVVTSRSGAALHDIVTTLRRRFSRCHVVLSPAVVQGSDAPRELVSALAALERYGRCDVVIIGRGGGAAEDLAAFNDEAVVRAVAAFPVPIVSAVGHEVDYTLCDLAADLRAATPTAAAESVVPVLSEILDELEALDARLRRGAARYLDHLRHRVGNTAGRLKDPAALVAENRQRADEMLMRLERSLLFRHRSAVAHVRGLGERLYGLGARYVDDLELELEALEKRMHHGVERRRREAVTAFAELRSKLGALSPLAVLERGYSLTTRADGRLVRDSGELAVDEDVVLRFQRGLASARITSTEGSET
jgi:exodeoxyribonuclease VII large subunit